MAGTREANIEQSQVLAQALTLGDLHLRLSKFQVQSSRAILIRELKETRLAAIHGPKAGDERQQDKGILQALALVDCHHLDQIGVTFQANNLLVSAAARIPQLRSHPPDQ